MLDVESAGSGLKLLILIFALLWCVHSRVSLSYFPVLFILHDPMAPCIASLGPCGVFSLRVLERLF
jgi:hypothetical protein